MDREPIDILGLTIHPMTMEESIGWIFHRVRFNEEPSLVFTLNPEIFIMARRDYSLAQRLEEVDLSLPDGIGVLLASRYLGSPLEERVTGIDLLENLLERGSREGITFYFLGGRPGVAREAAERMERRYSNLQILGSHHGYLEEGDREGVLEEIHRLRPQILFVGMGAPRQEDFLLNYREELSIGVGITVGGSFDVLAGELKRAPDWVISCHLEWLYRLIQEPSRWKRMLTLPTFFYLILKERKSVV